MEWLLFLVRGLTRWFFKEVIYFRELTANVPRKISWKMKLSLFGNAEPAIFQGKLYHSRTSLLSSEAVNLQQNSKEGGLVKSL